MFQQSGTCEAFNKTNSAIAFFLHYLNLFHGASRVSVVGEGVCLISFAVVGSMQKS